MRVGILTGGGDCPGLNAVIRAVAKSLIQLAGAEVVGIEQGFLGLIERRVRPLDLRSVAGIMATGGTILGTHNKANPFGYFGAGGADVSDAVLRLRARARASTRSSSSAATAAWPSRTSSRRKGVPIVGCPKTIDNDLAHTDRSFGFDTAVAIVTDALDRLQTTGQQPRPRDDPRDHGPLRRLDRAACRPGRRRRHHPDPRAALPARRGGAGVPRARGARSATP